MKNFVMVIVLLIGMVSTTGYSYAADLANESRCEVNAMVNQDNPDGIALANYDFINDISTQVDSVVFKYFKPYLETLESGLVSYTASEPDDPGNGIVGYTSLRATSKIQRRTDYDIRLQSLYAEQLCLSKQEHEALRGLTLHFKWRSFVLSEYNHRKTQHPSSN